MKLAMKAYVVTLVMLMLAFAATAQTKPRSDKDPRNTAPTVGTGGAVGGPTGLFTIYDGQTLRKGEWTISVALSNYDRDPGDADFSDVPASFQIGLTNRLELFFNTNIFQRLEDQFAEYTSRERYLPNAQGYLLPAIVLAPKVRARTRLQDRRSSVRRACLSRHSRSRVQFAGRYGLPLGNSVFGFPAGTQVTLGTSGRRNGRQRSCSRASARCSAASFRASCFRPRHVSTAASGLYPSPPLRRGFRTLRSRAAHGLPHHLIRLTLV